MARSRTPLAKAKALGRTLKDPKRYVERYEPKVRALGNPYPTMTKAECEYWRAFSIEFPWLASSDRQQLRILCQLFNEYDRDPAEFSFNKLNLIRRILNSFGGNPVSRVKIDLPDDEDDDPAREFIN